MPRSPGSILTAALTPDWDALEAYLWVQAMQTCPQDPVHHAEGDVWTHTRLVCEALAAVPDWLGLPTAQRRVLMAAAVLHDMAKPQATQQEGERIYAPGHARLGEKMARELLWDEPLDLREQICALVRLHGLPVWTLERANPLAEVIGSALRLPNAWLHRLARADMEGRVCQDQDEMLLQVDLFREYCLEQGCLEVGWPFANAHSRFHFFQHKSPYPAVLFDDTRFELTLMCGVAGSGKDTCCQELDLPVVSLDDLRRAHRVGRGDKRGEGRIVQLAYEQARTYARAGQSFVWNSTNLLRDLRGKLIRTLLPYQPYVRIIYVEASRAQLLQRRQGEIPEREIVRMMQRLELPQLDEAHELWLLRN